MMMTTTMIIFAKEIFECTKMNCISFSHLFHCWRQQKTAETWDSFLVAMGKIFVCVKIETRGTRHKPT